jgi:hypothetical protein
MSALLACRARCYTRGLYDSYFIITTKLNYNIVENYAALNFYNDFFSESLAFSFSVRHFNDAVLCQLSEGM